ncbi:unnamed protein product [Arctogadus glacialis]
MPHQTRCLQTSHQVQILQFEHWKQLEHFPQTNLQAKTQRFVEWLPVDRSLQTYPRIETPQFGEWLLEEQVLEVWRDWDHQTLRIDFSLDFHWKSTSHQKVPLGQNWLAAPVVGLVVVAVVHLVFHFVIEVCIVAEVGYVMFEVAH